MVLGLIALFKRVRVVLVAWGGQVNNLQSAEVKIIILMSDLSFLIENHNEVLIDSKLIEKYQQKNDVEVKSKPSNLPQNISSKDLKLNRHKNLITAKKKLGSPRSFNLANSNQSQEENQQLVKLTMRVQALQENQKRMQKRIGVECFQLKEQIQKRNTEQAEQFEEVRRLKGNMKQTKRNIAELLTLISKRK